MKTEVRLKLDQKEIKLLDDLKELLSCLTRTQVIRVLIRLKGQEVYK